MLILALALYVLGMVNVVLLIDATDSLAKIGGWEAKRASPAWSAAYLFFWPLFAVLSLGVILAHNRSVPRQRL